MNYNFSVRFQLFNNSKLSTHQKTMRKHICDNFHNIIITVVNDFINNKYKYLNRYEPVICSLDEKKQLRMCMSSMFDQDKTNSHYIVFTQSQNGGEYFSLEELREICEKIQKILEDNYLPYETGSPELFIAINNI
jgi:hypothetical protein